MATYSKKILTPPNVPLDGVCRTMTIPDSQEWLGVFNALILQGIETHTWEQLNPTDLTPDEASSVVYQIYEQFIASGAACQALAPYWDDPEGDDLESGVSNPAYPFYEDVANWLIAGFVAYTAGIGAALEYWVVSEKFRLAFHTGGWGGVIKVIIDGSLLGEVDTYSASPGMTYFDVWSPGSVLRLEVADHWNENATFEVPAVAVVRKRLWAGEIDFSFFRVNPATQVWEITYDGGETWTPSPGTDPRMIGTWQSTDVPSGRCDAATRMAALIRQFVEIFKSTVDATILINLILVALLFVFPIAWSMLPFIFLLVEVVLLYSTTQIDEAFSETVYDRLTCLFYANITEAGLFDTNARWNNFSQDIQHDPEFSSVARSILEKLLYLLGAGGCNIAAITRQETGECLDCKINWCHTYDFPNGQDGWVVLPGYANYTAGVGFTKAEVGGRQRCVIDITLPTAMRITHVGAYIVNLSGAPNHTEFYMNGLLKLESHVPLNGYVSCFNGDIDGVTTMRIDLEGWLGSSPAVVAWDIQYIANYEILDENCG